MTVLSAILVKLAHQPASPELGYGLPSCHRFRIQRRGAGRLPDPCGATPDPAWHRALSAMAVGDLRVSDQSNSGPVLYDVLGRPLLSERGPFLRSSVCREQVAGNLHLECGWPGEELGMGSWVGASAAARTTVFQGSEQGSLAKLGKDARGRCGTRSCVPLFHDRACPFLAAASILLPQRTIALSQSRTRMES